MIKSFSSPYCICLWSTKINGGPPKVGTLVDRMSTNVLSAISKTAYIQHNNEKGRKYIRSLNSQNTPLSSPSSQAIWCVVYCTKFKIFCRKFIDTCNMRLNCSLRHSQVIHKSMQSYLFILRFFKCLNYDKYPKIIARYNSINSWEGESLESLLNLPCGIHFMMHQNKVTFSIISQDWDGRNHWNTSTWKTRTLLSSIVNIVVADVLAPSVTRTSAAKVLTYR